MWKAGAITGFICYLLIVSASILSNAAVVAYLLRQWKLSTPYTFIVLHIHVSKLLEGISTLPFIFSYNNGLCYTAEMVHYYSVMMNAFCVSMLVHYYCVSVFDTFHYSREFIRRYGYYVLICTPLLVLFRFLDERYKRTNEPWCIIHSVITQPLYFFTYFFWIWLLLVTSVVRVSYATYNVHRRGDAVIAWRFFSTIGFYTMIALLNWIPMNVIAAMRTNADDDESTVDRLSEQFPFYICGVLYAIIFFRDHEKLEKCEDYHAQNDRMTSNDGKHLSVSSSGSFRLDTVVHFRTTDIMQMLDNRESLSMVENPVIIPMQVMKKDIP